MVSEKTLKVLDTLITELKIGYCKMCQMITKCMCYNEVKMYFKIELLHYAVFLYWQSQLCKITYVSNAILHNHLDYNALYTVDQSSF